MRRTLIIALCLTPLVLTATGCRKSLFPAGTPRTQYEAHDRLRRREAPLTEPDAFGNPQPALRARLSQRQWQ